MHYDIPFVYEGNYIDALDAARRLAGVAPLDPTSGLDAHLAAQDSAADVAADLAASSLFAPDPAAWLEDARERLARAQVTDAIRQAVRSKRADTLTAARGRLTRETVEAVRPTFDKAAKALTKAAAKLPTPDPFDLAAVVDADAAVEMKTAAEALRTMAVLAGIYGKPAASTARTMPRGSHNLAAVVDVPHVDTEQRHPHTRELRNPSEARDAIRRLLAHAAAHGDDAALVAVARGDYGPQVRLHLAADRGEQASRQGRYRAAAAVRREFDAEPIKTAGAVVS